MTQVNLESNVERHDVSEPQPASIDDQRFARLIGAIETQNKMIDKIGKKINTFIDLTYLMIFLSIIAAGCSVLGLL